MSASYYTSEDVPQARCCTGAVPGNSLALVELTFYSRDKQIQISTKERGTESEATQTGQGVSTSRKQ